MPEISSLAPGFLPQHLPPAGERGDVHAGELALRQHLCRAAPQSCRERESRETAFECERGAARASGAGPGRRRARALSDRCLRPWVR